MNVCLRVSLVRCSPVSRCPQGNTVKLGISMQQCDWPWVGIYFACIAMFFVGTVCALFMIQKLGTARSQHLFLFVFCTSFVLVDGVALAVDDSPEEYNLSASLVSSLAAFALGGQNLLSQKSAIVKGNTTFMTGNIQASGRPQFARPRPPARGTPAELQPTTPRLKAAP